MILCFAVSLNSFSQSIRLKTKYLVPKCIGGNCLKKVEKESKVIHKAGEKIQVEQKKDVNGFETTLKFDYILKEDVKSELKTVIDANDWGICERYSGVKFKEDKLYVNKWLVRDKSGNYDDSRNDTYYFKLQNRESLSLEHKGYYLSGLVIPLKYRPSLTDSEGNKIGEKWTTDFNANLFLSATIWGSTRFTHLKNLDNAISDQTFRIGGFAGFSTIKLNSTNTENAPAGRALGEGDEITKGLFSFGLGFTYTFNRLGIGAFLGWDLAMGQNSNIWDYDGAPWIGISVGFDILKIGSVGSFK